MKTYAFRCDLGTPRVPILESKIKKTKRRPTKLDNNYVVVIFMYYIVQYAS